jgi:GNAT superfamily N-acetyltransferase
MIEELPLTKTNRMRLARAFAHHPRIDIGIECALESQMGEAYVDDVGSPSAYMIEQGGFFGYLAGDATSAGGQALLKEKVGGHMLMPSPGWDEAVRTAYGDKVRTLERYSFSSESLSLDHIQAVAEQCPATPMVRRVDIGLAQTTEAPFLSVGDFESAEDFTQRGIGFVMYDGETIIGGAYSSLVSSRAIEVSVFVDGDHRRKGVATALSCALLTWCVERRIHPNWDAANKESVGLATKLGYTPMGSYTAYYIERGG